MCRSRHHLHEVQWYNQSLSYLRYALLVRQLHIWFDLIPGPIPTIHLVEDKTNTMNLVCCLKWRVLVVRMHLYRPD